MSPLSLKLTFAIVVIASAVFLLGGCDRAATTASEPPAPKVTGDEIRFAAGAPQLRYLVVGTAKPDARETRVVSGRLAWNEERTVRVYPPVAGRVRAIAVKPGAVVAAKEPLAVIESPDFAQAQSDAAKAARDVDQSRRDHDRIARLLEIGAAAKKDLLAADTDLAEKESELARARAKLAFWGGAEGVVDGLYRLPSPVAGTVVELNANPGQELRPDQAQANVVQLQSAPFVVSDPASLWLLLDIDEATLPSIRPGMAVAFGVASAPGRTFEARVAVVAAGLDPATRVARVRAEVDNRDGYLKPETYVGASLTVGDDDANAVVIPSSAVLTRDDKHYAFVRTGEGVFARREIAGTEKAGGAGFHVRNGLRDGDAVVTDGSLLLEALVENAG